MYNGYIIVAHYQLTCGPGEGSGFVVSTEHLDVLGTRNKLTGDGLGTKREVVVTLLSLARSTHVHCTVNSP